MAELIICPACQEYINLEIDIHRDSAGNTICDKCHQIIVIK